MPRSRAHSAGTDRHRPRILDAVRQYRLWRRPLSVAHSLACGSKSDTSPKAPREPNSAFIDAALATMNRRSGSEFGLCAYRSRIVSPFQLHDFKTIGGSGSASTDLPPSSIQVRAV